MEHNGEPQQAEKATVVSKRDGNQRKLNAIPANLKSSRRLRRYFTFVVFFILFTATLLASALIFFLMELGILGSLRYSFLIILIGLSIVLGTSIAIIVSSNVMKPVNDLGNAMSHVASGDFSVRLNENSRLDFLSKLNSNFNHMTEELSTVETLRDDFISNVSHEFKTPLSSIEGYAMLLQEKDVPPEAAEEYVSRILANSRRLSALVGNILMLSKIENQTIPMNRNVYRIDEQIRQSIVMLEDKWSKNDIAFDMDMDSIEFNAIEGLMSHVFYNLIDNAVKFSPPGSVIYIDLQKDAEQLTFRIANPGTPMSPETMERIFEKFYQCETSHVSEGNGLGLALVNKIVRLHGGHVSVCVTKDSLTEFTVVLPVVNAKTL